MKKIALLVFILGLTAASAKAVTVNYSCSQIEATDYVAHHFCNQFLFAFSESGPRYQLGQDGFMLRISSSKPPYAPNGVTMINVNITHTISSQEFAVPGEKTEVFLDSTMFAVVNRPEMDNTSQQVKEVLGLLDFDINLWNKHKTSH
jgi:hypothetical protein